MGINDFAKLSNETSSGSFSKLVAEGKKMIADGASHEELVANPNVVKLGIDSSYMRIKLRCRYLPKIVEKRLESSPHLIQSVLESSVEVTAEYVAEHMRSSAKAMLDAGVYQIYFFLEGESHIPKICMTDRKARKDTSVVRFETHVEQYVQTIQGIDVPKEGGAAAVFDEDDDAANFEDLEIPPVHLKQKEKVAIQTIAKQYTAASVETVSDRVLMVEAMAKLVEEYPNRFFIVSSQHEAELDAAFFYHIKLINHIYTVDTDVMVYGVQTIITDFLTNTEGVPFEVKYRHFNGFADGDYRFNARWERVAIAVLLGCDYNKRMPNVGKVKTCVKMEAIRKKMHIAYSALLAGQENNSLFAKWIKLIDAKIGHPHLTYTCQEYAEIPFECTAAAPAFADMLSKMVYCEMVNEKHLCQETWDNLGFAKCFVGLMHPTVMADRYRRSESSREITHATINAHKTVGFSKRYRR